MSKKNRAARNARRVADAQQRRHDSVELARDTLERFENTREGFRAIAELTPTSHPQNPVASMMSFCLDAAHEAWEASPVLLQADPNLVAALADTNQDVPLTDPWIENAPYGSVIIALREPYILDDGRNTCGYLTVALTGIRIDLDKPPHWSHTTVVPLPQADAVRATWLFRYPDNPEYDAAGVPRGVCEVQVLSVVLRGPRRIADTLSELVTVTREKYDEQVSGTGLELAALYALTVQLLMYLCSAEPDISDIPPERREPALRGDAARSRVSNLGWHVGGALRNAYRATSRGRGPGSTGRTLAPHMRAAHWTRVRVATRDERGAIIGDRLGEQGTDWNYQPRWIGPTAVGAGGTPAPTIRNLR